jgi:flavin-binding protein dodecin
MAIKHPFDVPQWASVRRGRDMPSTAVADSCRDLQRRHPSGRRPRLRHVVFDGRRTRVRDGRPSTYDRRRSAMPDSVYRVTEIIGVSSESWEAAARNAIETAGKSIRDLRIAEVVRQDVTIENGGITSYRVRLGISFKYDPAPWTFPS